MCLSKEVPTICWLKMKIVHTSEERPFRPFVGGCVFQGRGKVWVLRAVIAQAGSPILTWCPSCAPLVRSGNFGA